MLGKTSLLSLACSIAVLTEISFAGFEEEFDFIQRLELNAVGRDHKIAALEKLVRDYPEVPARARAMMEIGALWSANDPDRGFLPSPKKSMRWFREAASVAEAGSEDWFATKWILAGSSQDAPDALAAHLADIEKHASGDSLILARCELERFRSELNQGRLNSAEKRMQTLNQWYADPAHMPSDIDEKFELDHVIREPLNLMMDWYATAPMTPEERRQKIESIGSLAPDDRVVFGSMKHALKTIEIVEALPGAEDITESKGSNRMVFLYANIAVIILLLSLFLWQRLRTS